MTTATVEPRAEPVEERPRNRVDYLNVSYGVKSWLLTTDHKRIALLYMASITLMFFVGGFMAVLMRLELVTPEGDLVTSDTYNKLFTMHGIIMVFFFLIPSIPAVLGNFLLPMMIGAKDLAFPRLNLLSWYIYIVGAVFTFWIVIGGGVDTGWTFYTPFSTTSSNTHVIPMTLGIFILGFSSILTGLNFIVTTQKMRAPGLTWFRLPLFVWAIYATSIIQVLATPVLAISLVLLAVERAFHIGIFDPKLGGDPLLFQHFFWFYSHPAVYIMILPGMGVVSELIPHLSRKKIFGYTFVCFATLGIAFFGFLVWGHHMFVAGESVYAAMTFSILSYLVAVPSAIKVFNWTATLYKGSVSYATPMLYELGFIGFNLTFFPQFILGYLGMPRRYHAYAPEFQVLNVMSSAGASILAVGYLVPLIYLLWSLRYGREAGANPWGAVGLEWNTTSPPPKENFLETPIVTWDAYEYPTPVEGHVA